MDRVLDASIPYFRHFEDMTRIPHGSSNEMEYSNYLVSWAKEHNLRYVQDELYNVVIYKPATPGYEDHPPVMLQGHMDMVCAKVPGSTHDFTKDPLDLYVEDGFLRARGTTLGGDDGVGVAYILALLEADGLAHPALECVFTVQEETGCAGAAALKKEYFQARRMIGLDDVGGGTSYVTSAGSQIAQFTRKCTWQALTAPAFTMEISGLLGGHSGVEIDKERGNAIKLAFRILYDLKKQGEVQLGEMEFGSVNNAIPNYGKITFTCALPAGQMSAVLDESKETILRELEFSDKGLTITLTPAQAGKVMSLTDSQEIIDFLRFLPDGMFHKSMRFPDLPTASCNVGVLRTQDEGIYGETCARGALMSYLYSMEEEHQLLCQLYHIQRTVTGLVAPFDYVEHSPIRDALAKTFHQVTGRELKPLFVHGGLEAGYFKALYPDMDIVTIGPLVLDEHMVTERLSLDSFQEIWKVLVALLASL